MRIVTLAVAALFLSACGTAPQVIGGKPCFPGYQSILHTTSFPDGTPNLVDLPSDGTLLGIASSTGEMLLKPLYEEVFMANWRFAFGRKPGQKTWEHISRENGTVTPTPFLKLSRAMTLKSEMRPGAQLETAFFGITNPQADGSFDMTLLGIDGRPLSTITRVGGKTIGSVKEADAVIQRNGTLLVNSQSDSGAPVSRLHRLDGSPISPFVPRILLINSVAKPLPQETLMPWMRGKEDLRLDFVIPLGKLEMKDSTHVNIYWPIDDSGERLRLPDGAAAMFPLRRGPHRFPTWGIVYSGPAGQEVEFGIGTASEIAAVAGGGARYTAFGLAPLGNAPPGEYSLLFARSAASKSWELLEVEGLKLLFAAPAGKAFATVEDARSAYQAHLIKSEQERMAAEAESLRKRAEEEVLAAAARRAAMTPEQRAEEARQSQLHQEFYRRLGSNDKDGTFLVVDQMKYNIHALKTAMEKWGPRHYEDIQRMKASNMVSSYTIAKWEEPFKKQAELERQREEERIKAYLEMTQREAYENALKNWDAGIRAGGATAASRASMDAFSQRINNDYNESLKKYNSGAQNWHWTPPGR